ncbi:MULTISPECIES: hypothetical protein [Chelativorans]|jgi:hypothetical protein|uniref:Uncharacterized protein n=1 Tax=Chelativorans sp. (strain BNC1) TaxID=266779 RepID=Q11BQ5_CHESB|nr:MULTISPECIES: hypothetical protein [Chelativorans]
MDATRKNHHQRSGTRFSKDGRTVFVWLRVDRRKYEFARSWALHHADADPDGTAEDQLEGYLNMALMEHMDEMDWRGSPEIEAYYRGLPNYGKPVGDSDDEIPF